MSIAKLRINNFKCFEKAEIDLSSLNIITGGNSVGKTTIIQAILFQLQSVGKSGEKTLNGKYISLGKIVDVRNCYTHGVLNVELDYSSEPNKQKEHVVYLTTNRIGAQTEYRQNENNDNEIGKHGEYAFCYLSRNRMEPIPEKDFIFNDEVGRNFGNQVDYWLQYFCGYSITAEEIDGTLIVKVSFQTSDHVKNFRAVDIGTGVSYLAVIIITALSCTKEDILIIENPELYLHPAAQSKFMEFFTFLAKNGLQIIIETHSDHIVNGVRKEIKRKHIDSNDVGVFFVQKENNNSFVERVIINGNGAIENQMKGFFDQIDDDLDVLLGFEDE